MPDSLNIRLRDILIAAALAGALVILFLATRHFYLIDNEYNPPELFERIKRHGVPPKAEKKDGFVKVVSDYLKERDPYPESLVIEKWSQLGYDKRDGWIVQCRYRSRDGEGKPAVFRYWFVVNRRQVLAVKALDSYR